MLALRQLVTHAGFCNAKIISSVVVRRESDFDIVMCEMGIAVEVRTVRERCETGIAAMEAWDEIGVALVA